METHEGRKRNYIESGAQEANKQLLQLALMALGIPRDAVRVFSTRETASQLYQLVLMLDTASLPEDIETLVRAAREDFIKINNAVQLRGFNGNTTHPN